MSAVSAVSAVLVEKWRFLDMGDVHAFILKLQYVVVHKCTAKAQSGGILHESLQQQFQLIPLTSLPIHSTTAP
jgi:hypothetical protein